MKSINEKYTPAGWTKTTTLTPSNPLRSSWPKVEGFDLNVFDLLIEKQINIDDDPINDTEDTTINIKLGHNELLLGQHSEHITRSDTTMVEKDKGTEYVYEFKVVDHNTNAIMYYKVELTRVEVDKVDKEQDEANKNLLDEDLEVIAVLDDDEDNNPFETEFDDAPLDYSKSDE